MPELKFQKIRLTAMTPSGGETYDNLFMAVIAESPEEAVREAESFFERAHGFKIRVERDDAAERRQEDVNRS